MIPERTTKMAGWRVCQIALFTAASLVYATLGAGEVHAQIAPSDVLVCNRTGGTTFTLPEGGPPGSEVLFAWCPADGPSGVLTGWVNLFEPGTTTLSDQVWVEFLPSGGPVINFASDPDFQDLASRPGLVLRGQLEETGAPQDLSAFFGLPAGWFTVQSDVTPDTDIPEPGTLGVAATALLSLAWRRRGLARR